MEPLTFQNLLKYCDHMIQFTVIQSYIDHIIWSIWYDECNNFTFALQHFVERYHKYVETYLIIEQYRD